MRDASYMSKYLVEDGEAPKKPNLLDRLLIKVSLKRKHIDTAKCGDPHNCAIAQALVDGGAEYSYVGNEAVIIKKDGKYYFSATHKHEDWIQRWDGAHTLRQRKQFKPRSFEFSFKEYKPEDDHKYSYDVHVGIKEMKKYEKLNPPGQCQLSNT